MAWNDLPSEAYKLREASSENVNILTENYFEKYHLNENYEVYFIEYIGDISAAIDSIDYAYVYIPKKFFAILFIERGMLNILLESVPEIIGVQQNFLYTLSELEINNEISKEYTFYTNSVPLDGEGVIVGIIGTGIDYLNPRFITETGESRVVAIWDQSVDIGPKPDVYHFGTEYNRANINDALRSKDSGKSPYNIVEHKDEVGHGTAIAGILGGRNLGRGDRLKSIAPKCEFAIVKLEEAAESTLELVAGIKKNTKNVYPGTSIASAIAYLSDLQMRLKKPMVVYLSLGTNLGGRDGETVLERFIDNLTNKRDFSIVTNTGNQGSGRTHTSGTIETTGATEDISVNVGEHQSSLSMSIHIRKPDGISFSITSPKGDSSNRIPIPSIKEQNKYLTYEKDGIKIRYFVQERASGAVNILIIIQNTFQGVWKVSLFGDYITRGLYDCWLLQSELLEEGTGFLKPDAKTTLLTPCSAVNIISTSYYNQINNTIIESSGKGFPRNGIIEPTLTIGGLNLLTTGLNDSLILGSGAAMAGAILAGTVALIYQWGVAQGNLPELYPPRLRNILIASTAKEGEKVYPNDEWGFGKLSLNDLYGVMVKSGNGNGNSERTFLREQISRNLYINIPMETYRRLK